MNNVGVSRCIQPWEFVVQNTRLNLLVTDALGRFGRWLLNPWRRISLVVMSLLLGNFLATAFATTAGQSGEWDIFAGLLLVLFTEIVSWLAYRRRPRFLAPAQTLGPSSIWVELLNAIKLGLIYGLFIEAFKLGS